MLSRGTIFVLLTVLDSQGSGSDQKLLYRIDYRTLNHRIVIIVLALCCLPVSGTAQIVNRSSALNAQLHRAEIAWKSGASLLEAKVRVDKVLTALPDDVDALKLRTKVLLSMSRDEEALVDATRAVAIAPNDGDAQLLLAKAAERNGETELATVALESASKLLVEQAASHVELSMLARKLGLLGKAEAFARIALALRPDQSAPHIELARAFAAQGKKDAAKTILDGGISRGIVSVEEVAADPLLRNFVSEDLN